MKEKPVNIKQQKHYTCFKIQPIEFIGTNEIGYLEGNVIKYICRYRNKNKIEDLKKAQHYLEVLIKRENGERCLP